MQKIMLKKLLVPVMHYPDWALFVLRVTFCGLLMYNHAFVKMTLFSESPESFPDPVGLGSSTSYYLVVFSESICAALIAVGLFTRFALLPLLATMAVAVLGVHWENPWTDKELPLLYLAVYVAVFLMGPGRFSLDAYFFGKKARP